MTIRRDSVAFSEKATGFFRFGACSTVDRRVLLLSPLFFMCVFVHVSYAALCSSFLNLIINLKLFCLHFDHKESPHIYIMLISSFFGS